MIQGRKRQQILIFVLIIVVIIAGIVIYNYYRNRSVVVSPREYISLKEQKLKEIRLDFSILDDPLFDILKSYGVLPVVVGETGRQNPFISY